MGADYSGIEVYLPEADVPQKCNFIVYEFFLPSCP